MEHRICAELKRQVSLVIIFYKLVNPNRVEYLMENNFQIYVTLYESLYRRNLYNFARKEGHIFISVIQILTENLGCSEFI